MVKPQKLGKNTRMSFSKIDETLDLPNLIDVQKKSYEWFRREGLMEVLRDVSPITDYSGNLEIEFIDYTIDPEPKYSVEECKERDVNYAAPLRVTVRLFNKATGTPIASSAAARGRVFHNISTAAAARSKPHHDPSRITIQAAAQSKLRLSLQCQKHL